MHAFSRLTRSRVFRRGALVAGLLAGLAHAGCEAGDPLEAIRQQQAAGDLRGSLEPLRELLAASPDDPEANFLYGRALALTQQHHLAMWALRKAMKDPQWLAPAGLQLAYAALAAHDFNEVEEITGLVLEQEPENVSALLMRANAHAHWKKDPERALADADRVLELDPEAIEAYEPRILALLALGREEEARQAFAEVGDRLNEREAAPGVLAWHCATTAAFQQQGEDLEAARETWSRCLEEFPSNGEVVADAVAFYEGQGEPERAREVLRAALVEAPEARVFRASLAERLRVAGQAAEAEALLREATRAEDPALASAAWFDLGKHRQALGEFAAAADALERSVELARQAGEPNPELPFEYADALVLAGQLERAEQVAQDLSVPAHRHLILARVAQERRDPARALEEFDAGLRLWPDNPWARYQAAMAAEELGDFDRALEEFRYAIRNSPGATDARTRAARLLLAEGRLAQAIELLHTAVGQAPLDPEGRVLSVRLLALQGNMAAVRAGLDHLNAVHPSWAGRALARAAESVALRAGPGVALAVLASAPGFDFTRPAYAEALGALVRFAHEADEPAAAQAALEPALAAHPGSGALQAVRAYELELSGAPTDAIRAAYERAVELEPRNALALEGLGGLALGEDPLAALDYFDRAAAADPSDPQPQLQAARALLAAGQPEQAGERLDALLLEHPYEAEAALERARLDLQREIATARTLERAQRAVRFRGGAEALELLSQVHAQRGEAEPAARAAERARVLRERAAVERQDAEPAGD